MSPYRQCKLKNKLKLLWDLLHTLFVAPQFLALSMHLSLWRHIVGLIGDFSLLRTWWNPSCWRTCWRTSGCHSNRACCGCHQRGFFLNLLSTTELASAKTTKRRNVVFTFPRERTPVVLHRDKYNKYQLLCYTGISTKLQGWPRNCKPSWIGSKSHPC